MVKAQWALSPCKVWQLYLQCATNHNVKIFPHTFHVSQKGCVRLKLEWKGALIWNVRCLPFWPSDKHSLSRCCPFERDRHTLTDKQHVRQLIITTDFRDFADQVSPLEPPCKVNCQVHAWRLELYGYAYIHVYISIWLIGRWQFTRPV